MDHQKLNILLIFCTFSFGGCGGQGCYFWPNPRVIRKNSTIQDSQNTFKPKLACIFLPIRAKWSIQVCVETPCSLGKSVILKFTHLSTAVAWREKKFKHFVFYKYFCLVLGLLKSRISKKSFELLLRKLDFKLFHYKARVHPVSKITTIATRNRCYM